MAYTKPNDISFARSPILFGIYDANFTDAGFRYICNVYVWQGLIGDKPSSPNYYLEKYPSPNGAASFNVQSLAKDYFIKPQYTHSNYDDTANMYCWISVDLNIISDSGTGTAVVLDPIICFNGYNKYLEGVNYLTESHLGNAAASTFINRVLTDGGTIESPSCIPDELLGVTGNGYFMTDRPLAMDIPPGTSMHLYLFPDDTSLVAGYQININDGEEIFTAPTVGYVFNKVAAIPVGSTEIAAISKVVPTKWEVSGIDGDSNIITQTYTFTLVEPCRFGFRNLQFMNRYGVWDNLIIYGTQIEKLDVERTEIFNSPLEVSTAAVMTTNDPYGQYHMSGISGRESLTVNTGWISEDYNEVLKQLMLTEHLFDPDTSQPFTIDTKSLTVKTSLNNGLSFYTFDLKQANSATNTVY